VEGSEFIDFYEVLEISPNANSETIDRIFRYFAQRYHPDNPESGDRARFDIVMEAYNTLKDPANARSTIFSTRITRVSAGSWPRKPAMVKALNGMSTSKTDCYQYFMLRDGKTSGIPASAILSLSAC
jgi:curved DNA-binding protein CbpA